MEARNSNGERLKSGGAPVDVDIVDPQGTEVPAKVQDNQDGTFTVTYQGGVSYFHFVYISQRWNLVCTP